MRVPDKPRRVDFYSDEFLSGTIELTDDECGVYIRLCALIYSCGGGVSRERLRAVCKSHGNALNRIIGRLVELGKVVENGPEMLVKRCENELEKARKRIGNARENGQKGGRPPNEINDMEEPAGFSGEKLAGASFNHQPPTIRKKSSPDGEPKEKLPARLARDFVIPVDWLEDGADARARHDLPIANLSLEAERFCTYWWGKGRDAAKVNWRKTWINWCLNIRDNHIGANGNGRHKVSPVDDLYEGFARAAAEWDSGHGGEAAEPLLDSERSPGGAQGAGRGLDRRPH